MLRLKTKLRILPKTAIPRPCFMAMTLACVFILQTGCAGTDKLNPHSAGRRQCLKPQQSMSIVGGQSSGDRGVKKILLYTKTGEFLDRCTGVFISSTALLTAGHCVLNKANIVRAVLEDTGEQSTALITHPQYTMATGLSGLLQNGMDVAKASHSEYDLAVIKFQSRPRDIFKIGTQGRIGDTVTIIGYGDTENITTAVRANYKKMPSAEREAYMRRTFTQKSAKTTIASHHPSGYYYLAYGKEGGQPFAAFGDSGGPLLNAKRETIGVTSCGDPKNLIAGANRDILTGEWRNVYTDLNSATSKAFLENYLDAADLDQDADVPNDDSDQNQDQSKTDSTTGEC